MSGPLSLASQIAALEAGELDQDEVIALFQKLVDTGLAWQLQGVYGRTAEHFIREGLIQDTTPDE